jgi:hypothetical protein
MSKNFSVTFERWSHDDVEAGDTDDRGYVIEDCSLTDAIRLGLEYREPSWAGACEPDSTGCPDDVRWLTFYRWNDGTREYFETGTEEQRSLHIPDHVTAALRSRIVRLFNR